MNRWIVRSLHAATALLAFTGLLYAYFHYLTEPADPFAVVNHPMEPYLLQLHIVSAPVLVFLIGVILHSHILFKTQNGARSGRKSGLLLAWLFAAMVVSGYLLQVFTSAGHRFLFWLHLGSSSIWTLGYASHQIAAFRTRRVLQAQRTGAVLAIVMALLALFAARRVFAQPAEEPFEREVQAMGTVLQISLYEPDQDKALADSEAMIREVEAAEQQLSTWRADSELSRLNRAPVGQHFPLSPSLCALLREMQKWTERTEGAFDPGVGQLGEAWKIHDGFRFPTEAEIETALEKTGIRHLSINAATCDATRNADVLIDPGAFGKGEALDRALRIATARGSGPVLLNFGGQIAVAGAPPAKKAWNVALSDPADRQAAVMNESTLKDGSLATSGGSERDGEVNGKRISHILDPRTGQPVRSFGSVTAWGSTALVADVLSTALYVMGPEKGLAWANENDVAACYLIRTLEGISIRKSRRFSRLEN